jgi:eukaryotic-like serine/threonine-protein kinase
MTVKPGLRLGPYEVVAPLGAGGMGEVWRATDTRLDRSVAIKLLPEGFAQNEQFRARFEREAKTISSLNHPNICTLFDVGVHTGAHYLVMELLEGESLADRVNRGPLPLDQVLRFGAQIADALDRAHKQGIVHRDLKPGNVMLTKSGAKLLDFGLARSSAEASPLQASALTQAKPLTTEGTILGTFQYMAPEQLEGLEADARTDIFALGALLYEMATGRRAFQGTSRTSLIAAIVSSQPAPISAIAPLTPPALERVVRKCLEKAPDDRWQSAHDVASELLWISEGTSALGVSADTSRPRTASRVAWTLAVAGVLAAIAAGAGLAMRREPQRKLIESAIVIPAGMRIVTNTGLEIAPDGENIVLVLAELKGGRTSLWLRPLAAASFSQLIGTEGATNPFWSADSRRIAFFADGKLKTYDMQGSAVTVVADATDAGGGSWSADGTMLVGGLTGIVAVRETGGTPVPVTTLQAGETGHFEPFFLADGKTFLFAARGGPSRNMVRQASLEEPGVIRTVIPGAVRAGGSPRRVGRAGNPALRSGPQAPGTAVRRPARQDGGRTRHDLRPLLAFLGGPGRQAPHPEEPQPRPLRARLDGPVRRTPRSGRACGSALHSVHLTRPDSGRVRRLEWKRRDRRHLDSRLRAQVRDSGDVRRDERFRTSLVRRRRHPGLLRR